MVHRPHLQGDLSRLRSPGQWARLHLQLRRVATRQGPRGQAAALASRLHLDSEEFTAIWNDHQIDLSFTAEKRLINPVVGELTVHCQILLDPDQEHSLLTFTATPGTENYEKLQLLAVVGNQRMTNGLVGQSEVM